MQKLKHNKKQNVGLLYEQLVAHISKSVIVGDERSANRAVEIIERHYKKDSEILKEFKLFAALMNCKVSSDRVARAIVKKASEAALIHDAKKLATEKFALIEDINKNLGGKKFYDQRVDNYKTYATVQTLLNEWRAGTNNFVKVAEYEENIANWLCSPVEEDEKKFPVVNSAVVRRMTECFNEQYVSNFTDAQKKLMNAHVIDRDNTNTKKMMLESKKSIMAKIDSYSSSGDCGQVLKDKLTEVRSVIEKEDCEPTDESVTRFMAYIDLLKEIEA